MCRWSRTVWKIIHRQFERTESLKIVEECKTISHTRNLHLQKKTTFKKTVMEMTEPLRWTITHWRWFPTRQQMLKKMKIKTTKIQETMLVRVIKKFSIMLQMQTKMKTQIPKFEETTCSRILMMMTQTQDTEIHQPTHRVTTRTQTMNKFLKTLK